MEEKDDDLIIDNYFQSANKEEFKKVKSIKELYANLEMLKAILEPLNEAKIFLENPGLKITKTIKSKVQIVTIKNKLKYKEDSNLIKDIKCFRKVYEENAIESNKTIDNAKNNFINLSNSISNLIDLFEKVKNNFFNAVESMTNPILMEIKKIKEIDEKKIDKAKMKEYKEKKNKLNDDIENYDKNLSQIIIEIKDILIKIKDNIINYIQIMNSLDGPINSMVDSIEKIFEDFEEKSKEFIKIIYTYETSEEKKKAFEIFDEIKKLNFEMVKLVDSYGEKLNTQSEELEIKRKECLNDFDKITELNNESLKKLNDLQFVTKDIINGINGLLDLADLKAIDNNVQEYKGLLVDNIKSNVEKGTKNMIEANKKIEVDVSKLKKFIQEKQEKANAIVSLDLLFIMDATGSMESYLNFAKEKMLSVINKITANSNVTVNLGFIGYKDYNDKNKYIIYPDFTNKIEDVKNFIKNTRVEGGDDICEDMVGGLNTALSYSWKSYSRFAMLIADAPCHGVQYHGITGIEDFDSFPQGDPVLKIDEVVKKFAENNINLLCLNLKDNTRKLYNNFKIYYEKGKKSNSNCEIIVEDFKLDPEKLSEIIISQAKNFYEKRHETVLD
jgi:hypothetical protein